ncbi:hypothetical protein EB796_014124 [Bugula neritina]|uniref:Uncharacterized protein n=1 Tax=Bugula neritina TaxID=10212 RepID=A0A7J7JMN2_BUGNE|nr:hypothetical protein EB796_014124 [Bugula neritina]
MLLFCQLPTTTTSTTTTTEAITTTTFSIDQLVTTPADISDVKTAPMSKQMLLILGLGISGGVVCLLFIAVFIILIVKHKNGKTKCSIVFKGEKTDQTENVNIIVLN